MGGASVKPRVRKGVTHDCTDAAEAPFGGPLLADHCAGSCGGLCTSRPAPTRPGSVAADQVARTRRDTERCPLARHGQKEREEGLLLFILILLLAEDQHSPNLALSPGSGLGVPGRTPCTEQCVTVEILAEKDLNMQKNGRASHGFFYPCSLLKCKCK